MAVVIQQPSGPVAYNLADHSITVGTVSTDVVPANDYRTVIVFSNLSGNDIVIRPAAIAPITRGILLPPGSEMLMFQSQIHGPVPSRQWTAIASAGGSVLYCGEILWAPNDPI